MSFQNHTEHTIQRTQLRPFEISHLLFALSLPANAIEMMTPRPCCSLHCECPSLLSATSGWQLLLTVSRRNYVYMNIVLSGRFDHVLCTLTLTIPKRNTQVCTEASH
jgi:hypothetical protein